MDSTGAEITFTQAASLLLYHRTCNLPRLNRASASRQHYFFAFSLCAISFSLPLCTLRLKGYTSPHYERFSIFDRFSIKFGTSGWRGLIALMISRSHPSGSQSPPSPNTSKQSPPSPQS
jgi:hypothetical protein